MNSTFQEYATGQAFVLTLTKNQIDSLRLVVEHGTANLNDVSGRGLLRRGLIEPVSIEKKWGDKSLVSWTHRPTLAGRFLYQLLSEAGFVDRQNAMKDFGALVAEIESVTITEQAKP